MNNQTIEQAAKSFITNSSLNLSSEQIVAALLEAEKDAKKNKVRYPFQSLIGTWRLCFITGTKKTRARAGIVLGAGRYIPKFIKINISYAANISEQYVDVGTIENSVEFGTLKLTLTGVTKFLHQKNILAFDFTRMKIKLFGAIVYQGFIRGGERKEQEFYAESVGKQAFFSYFLIQDEMIAARGRGGGLALWVNEKAY